MVEVNQDHKEHKADVENLASKVKLDYRVLMVKGVREDLTAIWDNKEQQDNLVTLDHGDLLVLLALLGLLVNLEHLVRLVNGEDQVNLVLKVHLGSRVLLVNKEQEVNLVYRVNKGMQGHKESVVMQGHLDNKALQDLEEDQVQEEILESVEKVGHLVHKATEDSQVH